MEGAERGKPKTPRASSASELSRAARCARFAQTVAAIRAAEAIVHRLRRALYFLGAHPAILAACPRAWAHRLWREVVFLKLRVRPLLIALAVPLAAGGLAALLSGGGMEVFQSLNQPPLSPPGWLFPVAWTLLYLLMGAASYLAYTRAESRAALERALLPYAVQLAFNFLWPIFFFRFSLYLFSFFWLVALWLLILATAQLFRRISRAAGNLLIPYLAWVAFAGYLNMGVYLLN